MGPELSLSIINNPEMFLAKLASISLPKQMRLCRLLKIPVTLISVYLFFFLLLTPPNFYLHECPSIATEKTPPHLTDEKREVVMTSEVIDCAALFNNDTNEIKRASQYSGCASRWSISDRVYISMTADCKDFITKRKYNSVPNTKEEQDFPIAFSILMFEHVEQTERLLRAIYRPQNTYCIHVDTKASATVKQAMDGIANCFDNVFIASRLIDVKWAWFPVLEAEIICMNDLVKKSATWRYFINLTGREFPLKTNIELVRILKAYNGANDIDGTLWRRPIIWTKYHWRHENWMSWTLKSPPPHKYNIAKGSTHIAATRAFVEFVVYNQTAKDLLEWMRDIRSPDEHYFPTLNHNPQLGVPGAYTDNPDLKTFIARFKIWESVGEKCSGKWFRFICNFGVGDLHRLIDVPHIFANKFREEFDPVAYRCMEQWFYNRSLQGVSNSFDIKYYESRPWVLNHH